MLFEILLQKKFWIQINPRFSVPQRNLKNNSKTPPFWLHDRVWGEWLQRPLRCLPREIEYLPSSHFLPDGAIHNYSKSAKKNAFQRCYWLLQQYPRFKDRYNCIQNNLMAMIGQWYNDNVNDGWFCPCNRTSELALWEPLKNL